MALYGCEKKPHSRVRQLPADFPKPHWLLSSAPVLFSWLLLSSLPQKRQDLWATAWIALPTPTSLMGSSYGQGWHIMSPWHSSGSELTVMTSLWQTIPTLVLPTLLPLAQLIWRNLVSQCRTGVAGSILNELFRNTELQFPHKSQKYALKNSHAPKPSQQKHNVLFSTRKRGKELLLIEKQKWPISWKWWQICRHVYWQIVLLPGKYFSTKLVNVCSLCS